MNMYRPTQTTADPLIPPKGGSSADKSISKNRLCMYLADLQLSTDQYTEEGQTEWHLLEHLINTIKNW